MVKKRKTAPAAGRASAGRGRSGREGSARAGLHLPAAAAPKSRRGAASPRAVQVGEALRQALGEMLGDGTIKDPRLGGRGVGGGALRGSESAEPAMVTITGVEMTPDLRLARVYFSAFPDEAIPEVFRGLRSAGPEMRRSLADRIDLRYTPELAFFVDESIARGAKIEALLREIRDEVPPPADADVVDAADAHDEPDVEHDDETDDEDEADEA